MNSVYDYVKAELPKHKKDLAAVAREAGVGYSWIRQICENKIPNPGVVGIEKVAQALKARAQ